jgi:hypothetical protein
MMINATDAAAAAIAIAIWCWCRCCRGCCVKLVCGGKLCGGAVTQFN